MLWKHSRAHVPRQPWQDEPGCFALQPAVCEEKSQRGTLDARGPTRRRAAEIAERGWRASGRRVGDDAELFGPRRVGKTGGDGAITVLRGPRQGAAGQFARGWLRCECCERSGIPTSKYNSSKFNQTTGSCEPYPIYRASRPFILDNFLVTNSTDCVRTGPRLCVSWQPRPHI